MVSMWLNYLLKKMRELRNWKTRRLAKRKGTEERVGLKSVGGLRRGDKRDVGIREILNLSLWERVGKSSSCLWPCEKSTKVKR